MEQMTDALAREELKRAQEGDMPWLSRGEISELLQAWLESDALRKDAERYRWLRSTTNWASSNGERIDVRNNPALWDSAIDAAMQASAAKEPQ